MLGILRSRTIYEIILCLLSVSCFIDMIILHTFQELKKEESNMKEALENAKQLSDSSNMNPEDAVSATAPLYRQLVNAHAEEAAVHEAIYYLGEALKHEIIDCDVFLKQVRKMARKQFFLRATMSKCRQVAGLQV